MNYYYFFLFIISLFSLLIYSNVLIVIFLLLVMFFFLLANFGEAASHRYAAAAIAMNMWRSRATRPCARWRQGLYLLCGASSLLRCQGVVIHLGFDNKIYIILFST